MTTALGRDVTLPGPPYRLARTPAALRSARPPRANTTAPIYVDELG